MVLLGLALRMLSRLPPWLMVAVVIVFVVIVVAIVAIVVYGIKLVYDKAKAVVKPEDKASFRVEPTLRRRQGCAACATG